MALNLKNILSASLSFAQCCRFLCVNLPTWMHRTCRTATPLLTATSIPTEPWPLLLIINWHDYEAAEPTKNSTLTYTRAAVNKLLQVHPSSRTWWGEGQRDFNLGLSHGRKETISRTHACVLWCSPAEITGKEPIYCVPSPPQPWVRAAGLELERTGGPSPERNQETER